MSAPSRGHWFEPAADRMGASYLRYAHTKGTVQEVDHLVEVLRLRPGVLRADERPFQMETADQGVVR